MKKVHPSIDQVILNCPLCGNNWPRKIRGYESVNLRCDCEVTALLQKGQKPQYSVPVEKFYRDIQDSLLHE